MTLTTTIVQSISRHRTSTDAELLALWLSKRDEYSFTLLLSRHGPLVWGVCRRMRLSQADAEDVFQAVFLVLCQQGKLFQQRSSLACWLYGITLRIAKRLQRTQVREKQRAERIARTEAVFDNAGNDFEELDSAVNHLPQYYRDPLILCCLQGQTHQQAARILGWPVGTVAGRLSRAKSLLRSRLMKQGCVPAALHALLLPEVYASLPAGLISRTVQAIQGGSSASVITLAHGAILMVFTFRSIIVVSVALLICGLVVGWKVLAQEEPAADSMIISPITHELHTQEPAELAKLQGAWTRHILNEVTGKIVAAEDIIFEGNSYRMRYHPMEMDGTKSFQPKVTELKTFKLLPEQKRIELVDYNNDAALLQGENKPSEWPTHLVERFMGSYVQQGETLEITFDGKIHYKLDGDGKPIANREVVLPLSPQQAKKVVVFRRMKLSYELEDKLSAMLRPGDVVHGLKLDVERAGKIKEGDRLKIEVEVKSEQGISKTEKLADNIEVLAVKRTVIQEKEYVYVFLRLNRPLTLTLKYHVGKQHVFNLTPVTNK
ncbi:MAG: RNA polymerase sigma factor [Planctomycetia bacterium]|nr:RNA polymerase sigma factor [Planctomycetia bacterium]